MELRQTMFLTTQKHVSLPECSHIIEKKISENTNTCMSNLQKVAELMRFICLEMIAHVLRIVQNIFAAESVLLGS